MRVEPEIPLPLAHDQTWASLLGQHHSKTLKPEPRFLGDQVVESVFDFGLEQAFRLRSNMPSFIEWKSGKFSWLFENATLALCRFRSSVRVLMEEPVDAGAVRLGESQATLPFLSFTTTGRS